MPDTAPSTITQAAEKSGGPNVRLRARRFGEILAARGAVTQGDLEKALAERRQTRGFLGQILLKRGVIKKRDLAEALED